MEEWNACATTICNEEDLEVEELEGNRKEPIMEHEVCTNGSHRYQSQQKVFLNEEESRGELPDLLSLNPQQLH